MQIDNAFLNIVNGIKFVMDIFLQVPNNLF